MRRKSTPISKRMIPIDETTPKKKTKDQNKYSGIMPGREYIGGLFLILMAPAAILMIRHICYDLNGDVFAFKDHLVNADSPLAYIRSNWPSPFTMRAW